MQDNRKASTLAKIDRLRKTLNHEEPDRVPITDFFWGSFVRQWQKALDLPADQNPYSYYDLDWMPTIPNMDPHIKSFQTVKETDEEVVIKTGFEATLRKVYSRPMPEQVDWDINTIEKLEALDFDDPADDRRFFAAGDNHIAGVGDGFQRNSPAWVDTVKTAREDIAVYGSVIECAEFLTRAIGQMNTLLWIGMYPKRLGKVINRVGQFYLDMTKAQLKAAEGLLDGFVIWGDMAYKNDVFFAPDYWRQYFKPWVTAITAECHKHNLPVIYHGCGNVKKVFEDFIETGIDAYNPLEAKAGQDAVEMRKQYGHRMAFCGNNNVQIWESNDLDQIRKETLYKLNAAKGGGYIFTSDHSVPTDVKPQTYDYIVKLVREYGNYPLNLGEFDVAMD